MRDGLRWVEPYFTVFSSTVSARAHPGVDISIIEYLGRRFPFIPLELHRLTLERALTVVNLERVGENHVVREGDVLSRLLHAHESPVLDEEARVVHEDAEVLVVDKPASWPVYPCGNHRLNSLVYILGRDRGYRNLRPIHRLDKATSGLVICAKQPEVTAKFQSLIDKNETVKEYLALVEGRFPEGSRYVLSPLSTYNINPGLPIRGPARPAQTEFTRLTFFPAHSVSLVSCRPITGRTHQIRLHLRELGFTIVNDDLYSSSGSYADCRDEDSGDARQAVPLSEYELERMARIVTKLETITAAPRQSASGRSTSSSPPSSSPSPSALASLSAADRLAARFAWCDFCPTCLAGGSQSNELIQPRFIGLHSTRYRLAGRDFSTDMPSWAVRPETLLNRVGRRGASSPP